MLNNYIDTTSTKNCSTSYLIRSASTVDLNMEGNFLRSMGCLEFWNAPQNKSVLTQSDKRMFPPQFAKWLSVKKNWSLKNWLSAVTCQIRLMYKDCTKFWRFTTKLFSGIELQTLNMYLVWYYWILHEMKFFSFLVFFAEKLLMFAWQDCEENIKRER